MNTNELLRDWGYSPQTHDNFGEIARFAADLAKSHSQAELMNALTQRWSPVTKATMSKTAAPFTMYGQPGIDFDFGAYNQMHEAMRLPVAVAGAIMPDAHLGYALNIGGVAGLHRAVSPSFVGYDIACRMRMTVIGGLSHAELQQFQPQFLTDLQTVSHFGGNDPEFKRDHPVMSDPTWKEVNAARQLKDKAAVQLGTSGGGNHFVELVAGTVLVGVPWLPLPPGQEFVGILTHSGSRGTGHKLATHYMRLAQRETELTATGIPKGYEWLSIDSDAGREYMLAMELMGRYAAANHQLIHEHFLAQTGLKALAVYENHHNFAWVEGDTVIHRKGATPAHSDQPGLIPGSCATPSFLVEGLGNEKSLNSSSHGAGRVSSRTQAKKDYDAELVQMAFEEIGVLVSGVNTDENPFAYKDIHKVMELQIDLVRPIAKMTPKVVLMGGGRQSDDGD